MLLRVPYVKLLPYNALVLITSECPLINLLWRCATKTPACIQTLHLPGCLHFHPLFYGQSLKLVNSHEEKLKIHVTMTYQIKLYIFYCDG